MSIKVYVDQGHNPREFNTGAEGNGYFEQDITYDIGKRLAALLSSDPDFEVRLSRPNTDTTLGFSNSSSLRARVIEANSWGADVFISLHTNAATNPSATGTESLIYSRTNAVAYELAEDITESISEMTGLYNRGVIERPGLYVLKETNMPAVIVEMGFITNIRDASLMVNSPDLFSEAIYRGIADYYD